MNNPAITSEDAFEVLQGLLRGDSPRGIWEISDEGRRWLEGQG